MQTRAHIVLVALSLSFVVGCGEPPTKEEVAVALNDFRNHDFSDALLRAMEEAGALVPDEPDSSFKPSAPPGAGAAPLLNQVIVEQLGCSRVDRKTYDCSVTWRGSDAKASTTGRYRFARGPAKWEATLLTP